MYMQYILLHTWYISPRAWYNVILVLNSAVVYVMHFTFLRIYSVALSNCVSLCE